MVECVIIKWYNVSVSYYEQSIPFVVNVALIFFYQTGEKRDLQGNEKQKLIKQYSLPAQAQIERITSRMGKDGRLQVNIPLARRDSPDASYTQ